MISKMGPIRYKLEQLLRESEGSFREVEGYFSTQMLGLYICMYVHVHLERVFWSFA